MKNGRILIIFVVLLIIVIVGGYFIIKYVQKTEESVVIEEYIPQEEITLEQSRQTILTLYFQDKETKELTPEARVIDIKEMINLPYETLTKLLIDGPKNEKLEKIFPDDVKINMVYKEEDCLTIDFSSEFLNYDKENPQTKENLIDSIVNTVTELTEINEVKILIDGEENSEFAEVYIRDENNSNT